MKIYHGWNIVTVGLLTQAVALGILTNSYGVFAFPMEAEFGASRQSIMWGYAALGISVAVFAPIVGKILDTYTIKYWMIGGTFLLSLLLYLLSLTSAAWQVVVIIGLLSGLGQGLLGNATAAKLTSNWFEKKRGIAMGIVSIGPSLGGFIIPPLLSLSILNFGWRDALALFAILVLLVIPILFLVVKNAPSRTELAAYENKSDNKDQKDEAYLQEEIHYTANQLLKDKNLWYLAVSMGTKISIGTCLISNLIGMASEKSIDATNAAFLISIYSFVIIISTISVGYIADKVNLRGLFAASAGVQLLAIIMLKFADSYSMSLITMVVYGIGAGAGLPVFSMLTAKLFGATSFGRAQGIIYPIMLSFMIVSSPLVGWIFDVTGSYSVVYNLLAGYAVLAIVSVLMIQLKDESRLNTVSQVVGQR